MALRTPEEYKESLRDGRRLFISGERVDDVTTHPILQITTEHSAGVYRHQLDPKLQDLFTFVPDGGRDRISRYFMLARTPDELLLRGDLIEEDTRLHNSTFNITKAVGSDAMHALTVWAHETDADLGTEYAQRVATWIEHCRQSDLSLALAQTDVKGDRSLRPHQQPNPDAYLHIVEQRADGIVVRGAKAHTTAAPVVNEIIFLPTRAMGEEDADYAVAFALPLNTPGLTLICRTTGDVSQTSFDFPISRRNIETETLTVLDNVFVPWERVFLCREWRHAGHLATTFANYHRYTAVSYKPPSVDLLIGAAQLAAEYNGTARAGHIRDKIAQLIIYGELIRACRNAAAREALPIEPGMVSPNGVYTNAGKYHFASGFHQAAAIVQDIAGGLVITAPMEADFQNPETGPYLEHYLTGAGETTAAQRVNLFHLIRDMTASEFGGYNFVTTLHGEGSMAAQLLTTYRGYDIERCTELVKNALDTSA